MILLKLNLLLKHTRRPNNSSSHTARLSSSSSFSLCLTSPHTFSQKPLSHALHTSSPSHITSRPIKPLLKKGIHPLMLHAEIKHPAAFLNIYLSFAFLRTTKTFQKKNRFKAPTPLSLRTFEKILCFRVKQPKERKKSFSLPHFLCSRLNQRMGNRCMMNSPLLLLLLLLPTPPPPPKPRKPANPHIAKVRESPGGCGWEKS